MSYTIQGMDALVAKLERLKNPTKPVAKGMRNYMGFIRQKVVPYPPESLANRKPGINGYSWYDRGYGTRTITGRAYKTSQKMDKRWSFKTKVMANKVRSTILNNATYSDYVQGEKQVWYHGMRGWRRVDKVIEASEQVAVRFIGKEIDRELNR